jgi:integrase
MSAPMERTRYPGVYKRGTKYIATYRDPHGRQRKESFRTLSEAKAAKDSRSSSIADGTFQANVRVTLHEYAGEWIGAYRGKGGRGFRENTRADYRVLLDHYALTYFTPRVKLTSLSPKVLADFVTWLGDADAQGRARAARERAAREQARREGKVMSSKPVTAKQAQLSPATIARACVPLRSLLRTATQQGLLRSNPALGLELPGLGAQPDAEYVEGSEHQEDEDAKVFTRAQLRTVLAVIHPRHRLMFELMAGTGLRISEVIALEWRHLALDGSAPVVRVRRAIVRGTMGAPKTRHGKRDVALAHSLVLKLRAANSERRAAPGDLVFPSERGTSLNPSNVRNRVLAPAVQEASAPWAAFHTFRHTFASMQVAQGCNIVQLSRALGHHSPSFTLSVYAHLFPGDGAPALEPLHDVRRTTLASETPSTVAA